MGTDDTHDHPADSTGLDGYTFDLSLRNTAGGKTTTTVNLDPGQSLSRRVLLIDTDPQPTMTRLAGAEYEPALIDPPPALGMPRPASPANLPLLKSFDVPLIVPQVSAAERDSVREIAERLRRDRPRQ
jgi:hypothetical protein